MDRYERITALHRLLKSARYPVTVATLQDKLGCSRATVYRDLAFLRDALMAPIEGDGEAGFRYQADESDRFELPCWPRSTCWRGPAAACCPRCWHLCSSASRACWQPRLVFPAGRWTACG